MDTQPAAQVELLGDVADLLDNVIVICENVDILEGSAQESVHLILAAIEEALLKALAAEGRVTQGVVGVSDAACHEARELIASLEGGPA